MNTSQAYTNTVSQSAEKAEEYSADAADLWQWIVYAVQGVFIVLTNGIICAAFGRHSAFRGEKEYIFVAGLALADCMSGIAYVSAGIDRSVVVLFGTLNDKVSAWDCQMTIHNIFWNFGDSISTLMLLVISIDRMMSALFLLQYISWGANYARLFVASAYVYGTIVGLVGVVISYQQPPDKLYPRICYSEYTALGTDYYTVQYTANTSFLTLSVVGYAVVWLLYRSLYKQALTRLGQSEPVLRRRAKLQKRLTTSLAISSLFTFVLCVIPYFLSTIIVSYFHDYLSITIVFWIVYNFNPMLNVIIYVKRHKEMQKGIKATLQCKSLPPSISNWTVPTASVRRSTKRVNAASNDGAGGNDGVTT